jgi:hypothetical protein
LLKSQRNSLAFFILYNYNYIIMRYKNFWTIKSKEKLLIKIIQWAQRNNVKVESLTKTEINCALKEEK